MKRWLLNGFLILAALGITYGGGVIGLLFVVAIFSVFSYLWAVHLGEQRAAHKRSDESSKAALEREQRIDAARTPEERESIERQRIRDMVIMRLPPNEKVMYIVPPPPDNPEGLRKFAPLSERVEKEVERILRERKAAPTDGGGSRR